MSWTVTVGRLSFVSPELPSEGVGLGQTATDITCKTSPETAEHYRVSWKLLVLEVHNELTHCSVVLSTIEIMSCESRAGCSHWTRCLNGSVVSKIVSSSEPNCLLTSNGDHVCLYLTGGPQRPKTWHTSDITCAADNAMWLPSLLMLMSQQTSLAAPTKP